MKGFAQELTGKTFIFRVGEKALEYGDDWSHACVFYVEDHPVVERILTVVAWVLRKLFPSKHGEFIGLHSDPMTLQAYRKGRDLAHNLGFIVSHKRIKGDRSYLMREIQGPTGELVMKHNHQRNPKLAHIPHTDEHKKDDGSLDTAAMEHDFPALLAAIKSGNPQIVDMDMTDPGPNGEYYVVFRMKAK